MECQPVIHSSFVLFFQADAAAGPKNETHLMRAKISSVEKSRRTKKTSRGKTKNGYYIIFSNTKNFEYQIFKPSLFLK
jgi:hypothetical protein